MHHAAAPRFTGSGLAALLAAACLALPAAARADLVYVVSKTTGGLFRFDSSNPAAITTVFGSNSFNQPSALALGDDGHLYIGESPGPGDGDPRILRYVIATGSISEVVNLSGTGAGYTGEAVYPAAIAFRRTVDGGEMLVGRNPDSATYAGPVMAVSGWQTLSPTVAAFTSGSLNASPGLAVSPATGTLYASNVFYGGSGLLLGGVVSEFDATQNPAPLMGSFTTGTVSGPLGLVVGGSMLYSTNPNDGTIFATNLSGTAPSSSVIGTAFFEFDVGTLARLSDGDLLAGSLVAGSGNIYRVSTSVGGATPLFGYGQSGFGQIGGIVTMVVPEPGSIALAACGLAAVVAWRRRRTVA
jgi:hypothetical protein